MTITTNTFILHNRISAQAKRFNDEVSDEISSSIVSEGASFDRGFGILKALEKKVISKVASTFVMHAAAPITVSLHDSLTGVLLFSIADTKLFSFALPADERRTVVIESTDAVDGIKVEWLHLQQGLVGQTYVDPIP